MRKHLLHLFIPRESNNHRAKILHLDSLVIAISFLIFTSFLMASVQKSHPAVLGVAYNITIADLLKVTNNVRVEKGLSPLKLNTDLSKAADDKASDMFFKNYWAHIAPDGVTPWVFIKNSGYEYLYAGENLARGFSGSADVVNAWMESPTHRDNMLSPNYNDVGFAIKTGNLTGSDTVLVVEMFGTKFDNKPIINNESPPATQVAALLIPSNQPINNFQIPEKNHNPQSLSQVAAIQQKPLIDKNDVNKNMIISILLFLLGALIIDAIVIERKKIIRAFSHNLDHIIYLSAIIVTIFILSKGDIL